MHKGIIASLVVIVILGLGIYLFTNTKNPEVKTNTTTTKTQQTTKTSTTTTKNTQPSIDGEVNTYKPPVVTDTTSPTKPATNYGISIVNFAFSPAVLNIKKGDTVMWTNTDSAPHTVTGDSTSGPHSGTMKQGDSYSFIFNTTGTFTYHCQIHPMMTAKVIVVN